MKHILCMTDTLLTLDVINTVLSEHYTLLIAHDAFKALELTSDNDIDLFIIDMDDFDYQEILEHIGRTDTRHRLTPMIGLAYETQEEHGGLNDRARFTKIVTKPLRSRPLSKAVDAIIGV